MVQHLAWHFSRDDGYLSLFSLHVDDFLEPFTFLLRQFALRSDGRVRRASRCSRSLRRRQDRTIVSGGGLSFDGDLSEKKRSVQLGVACTKGKRLHSLTAVLLRLCFSSLDVLSY